MLPSRLFCLSLVLALAALSGVPARGVVIAGGDRTANGSAPFNGPGWANVSGRGEGSAVYLGNRWMITARHVGAGPVVLDNRNFTVQPNTEQRLSNPPVSGLSQFADLVMFRLTEDPGIPGLSIVQTSPDIRTPVTMIGRGAFRDDSLSGWAVIPLSQTFFQWIETSTIDADALGYKLNSDRGLRWGTNNIDFDGEFFDDDNNVVVSSGVANDVLALATTFHEGALGNEAQAVEGDSGGGVFTYTPDGWQLAGIMTSTKLIPNQPAGTAVFGDQTYITDFSRYRTQILSIMNAPAPWQNQVEQFDVNNDGTAAASDVLVLINELNDRGARPLPHFPPTGSPNQKAPPFFDVNGDETLSALDVLTLVNHLNDPQQSTSLALAPLNFVAGTPVPEPATWVLAVGGAIGMLAAKYRRRRRS